MVTRKQARDNMLGVFNVERRIYDSVRDAMKEWLPDVRAAITSTTSLVAAADPNAVFSTVQQWERVLDKHVLPTVEQVMVDRMLERMEQTGVIDLLPPPPGDGDQVVGTVRRALYGATDADKVYAAPGIREWQSEHLATVENRLKDMPDSVFDLITDQIDLAMEAGDSEAATAARVQKILEWSDSDDWEGRARAIARTEATAAYNQSTAWAGEVTQMHTGVERVLGWMCVGDQRTRDSHVYADGQIVPIGSPFIIGGYEAKYPGDSALPAKERVNCRCIVVDMTAEENLPYEPLLHPIYSDDDYTQADATKEINIRADKGVVRHKDRDTVGDSLLATTEGTVMHTLTNWRGILAPLGKPTGDGRMFAVDATVKFREFPLPLMWQRQTSDSPHGDAFTVGSIRRAWMENGMLMGEGVLFDTGEAREAASLISEGVTRPSVDLCDDQWDLTDEHGNPVDEEALYDSDSDVRVIFRFTAFTVMAATLVAKPAFAEAKLELIDVEESSEEAATPREVGLVAAAPTISPARRELFDDPKFTAPTPLHMTPDGRIMGHLALWNDCHMGVGNACVVAPKTNTGYALFHVHETETTEGALAVGKLTVGGGHADAKLGVQPTIDHYDEAGAAFALVRAGEDAHGVWVSGVAAPWARDEQIMMGLSCPLSGDWRRHGGNLELVAALSVNTPGFPVPRGSRDSHGRDYALVAAGAMPVTRRVDDDMRMIIDTAVRESVAAALAQREPVIDDDDSDDRVAKLAATFGDMQERRLAALRTRRAYILARRMGFNDKGIK